MQSRPEKRIDAPLDREKIEEDLKNPQSLLSKSLAGFATAKAEELVEMWNIFVQNLLAHIRNEGMLTVRPVEDDEIVDYADGQPKQPNPEVVNVIGAVILTPNLIHAIAEIKALTAEINNISQQQINNFNTALQKILASNTLSPNMQKKLANFKMTPQFIEHLDKVYVDTVKHSSEAAKMSGQTESDPKEQENKMMVNQEIKLYKEIERKVDATYDDDRNLVPSEIQEFVRMKHPDTKKPIVGAHLDMQKQKHDLLQQREAKMQKLRNDTIQTVNSHVQAKLESLLKDATRNDITPAPKNGRR